MGRRAWRRSAVFVMAPIASAACASLVGLPDLPNLEETPGDGAAGDVTNPGDASASDVNAFDAASDTWVPTETVTGGQTRYFVTDRPLTLTPINTDFSGGITAYVLDGDGGVRAVQGTGSGNGTFSIDGIPLGATYYVAYTTLSTSTGVACPDGGLPAYSFSNARTLDLDEYILGRANVTCTNAGPDAAANAVTGEYGYVISGISSPSELAGQNSMELFSMNSGAFFTPGGSLDPVTGAPTSDASLNGSTLTGQDPVYTGTPITLPSDSLYAATYDLVVDAGIDPTDPPTYLSEGTPAFLASTPGIPGGSFDVTLQSLDAGFAVGADAAPAAPYVIWNRGAFVSQAGGLSAGGIVQQQFLGLYAAPYADVGGPYGSATLFFYTLVQSVAADNGTETVSLVHGDPFPTADWTRFVEVALVTRTQSNVPILPDGGSVVFRGAGFFQCFEELSSGATLVPLVTPPQNITVNNHTGFEDQIGTGIVQPVLSWEPPSSGTLTSYFVNIREIVAAPGATSATLQLVAHITTSPSIHTVTIPPGVLVTGHAYQFSITAQSTPSGLQDGGAEAPLLEGLPLCIVNTISGIYIP